ncbi:hypothetical protein OH77DRAFT_1432594 [Trametes cingulata]|nr:hypothetical protein OH77DRAFT_1432594 [Trametes cingulata]
MDDEDARDGLEGSQYDPELEDYASNYEDYEDQEVWYGSMRIVASTGDTPADSGTASSGGSAVVRTDNDHPLRALAPDFHVTPMRAALADKPSGPLTTQGSPTNPATFVAEAISEAMANGHNDFVSYIDDPTPWHTRFPVGDTDDDDEYADLPGLDPVDDEGPSRDDAELRAIIDEEVGSYIDDPTPLEYRGPAIELPLNEDLDWAWIQFVNSNRTDNDIEPLLILMYRMAAQNNHLFRQLADARNRADALSDSLGWTRRELAAALYREQEGLTTRADLSVVAGQRT